MKLTISKRIYLAVLVTLLLCAAGALTAHAIAIDPWTAVRGALDYRWRETMRTPDPAEASGTWDSRGFYFDQYDEFRDWYDANHAQLSTQCVTAGDVEGFVDTFGGYDETYFAEHVLLIASTWFESGTPEALVGAVTLIDGTLTVRIDMHSHATGFTCDMAYHQMLIEMENPGGVTAVVVS